MSPQRARLGQRITFVLLMVGVGGAVLVIDAPTALGETPTPTPSSGTPLIDVHGGGAIWLIIGAAVGIGLAWLIPLVVDAWRAYSAKKALRDALVARMEEPANKNGLTGDQVVDLLKVADRAPSGMEGLARALMALTIVSIVAVALIATLTSGAPDSADLRKTIIQSLLSVFATVIGFYFGARTAQTASAGGGQASGIDQNAPGPQAPKQANGAGQTIQSGPAPEQPSGAGHNIPSDAGSAQ